MGTSAAKEIINIIEKGCLDQNEKILLIKNIIRKMDGCERLQLHVQLTPKALAEVFRLRNELELEYDVIEHIMWQYILSRMK